MIVIGIGHTECWKAHGSTHVTIVDITMIDIKEE